MPATSGHNEACCNIPPVVSSGYSPKGSYEMLDEFKTYVTGPTSARRGLISIFDIFGFVDQTLQGADILADSDSHQKYKVFMPDWFEGGAVPPEWFPPDSEEKQQKLGEWFGSHGPHDVAARLPRFVEALKAANPSIESWGILGYCWGGKVVEMTTAAAPNLFTIAAVAHPAMIEPSAAKDISIPYLMLASGEDPEGDVQQFKDNLKVPCHVETFKDQVHGWMAARGDLSNEHVRGEYVRGYQTILSFFRRQWA